MTPADVSNYCLGRIKGKNGILHKQCNSTRLTKTMRCMESTVKPVVGASMAEQQGYICLLNVFFNKGNLLFMAEDGKIDTAKLIQEDLVIYGMCPSQGKDSALPLKAKTTVEGEFSMRVPLDVCRISDTNFNSDEAWLFRPTIKDVCKDLSVAWNRIWNEEGRKRI